ncbi:MAG: nucleotidyl transferase AbiEii/AbiGii toxin family protein [Gracilimonas sp.]|uniref:nucleotidyl transferase AbiEii/AbiGii toxin family protein n=1 Tax=Gracilimonas sp. TaxID=1974203 RepID=UPI001B1FBBE4|nr:nucleotidyl transferase AbiEii/AbiGii toxin family protein [Gracilimonas sp.]MBO6585328.1 nucleotidyl transferase AbiEii/AbiGii toxin family protein [Gracilimonas sp.]MBO6616324.1 nucleotidyl transferase AbiEii/AbiGii toxin family protein [Gracilimonas sp.]
MRKPLQIKLEDLRQDQLKELLQVVEKVFIQSEVDFYLLGAIARDTWYAKEQIESRATRDVDFAVYISEKEKYDEVLEELINNHGFNEIKDVPFRLQTPFTFTIDIIPFGEISIDEAVIPDESWDRPIFVNGFEEIFKKATIQVKDEGDNLEFKVATLPAILLLKLIAYDDRPEKRTQDPQDIAQIIINYFEVEKEMIWEEHHDLFDEDSDLIEIGVRVIGREISEILSENKTLKDRVLNILSLEDRVQKNMAEAMVNDDLTLEKVEGWFTLIKEEIEEE